MPAIISWRGKFEHPGSDSRGVVDEFHESPIDVEHPAEPIRVVVSNFEIVIFLPNRPSVRIGVKINVFHDFRGGHVFFCLLKKEKNEKRVSDSTDRVNNFNDSIESSQIHKIQPQEINGNLYYLSRLGLTGWDVNILDPLSTNIIPLKVYEYRIQIDSNFKTPHIKGVTNNGRHFGPMVILYDKKRIPIFVAQYK